MRHDRRLPRTRTGAGILLAVVLAAAGIVAAGHHLGERAPPADGTDPALVHRVDLNRADAAEVAALPGIGDVLAGRIVASRESEGGFPRLESLARVHGIGPGIIERIRPHVVCGPEGP